MTARQIVGMPKFSKVLLLGGVLLTLVILGVLVIWGFVYLNGYMSGLAADGEYGMMYVAGTVIFLRLSPSLLLPYAIFFWRTSCRVLASFISALICGVCYPLLLALLFAATYGLKLDPGEGYVGWAAYAGFALIPGVLLSFLGTYFGQGLKSRSSAVRSQAPGPAKLPSS